MKRRGWVVWTWGKMGGLLMFMGIMAMLLTAFAFANDSLQARSANRMSSTLRELITDAYNSAGDMTFEYALPGDLDGENYSIEILDKKGDTVGIITKTMTGPTEVFGGASFAIPLSSASFGVLKGYSEGNISVCVTKYQEKIYIEKSKCT